MTLRTDCTKPSQSLHCLQKSSVVFCFLSWESTAARRALSALAFSMAVLQKTPWSPKLCANSFGVQPSAVRHPYHPARSPVTTFRIAKTLVWEAYKSLLSLKMPQKILHLHVDIHRSTEMRIRQWHILHYSEFCRYDFRSYTVRILIADFRDEASQDHCHLHLHNST